MEIVIAILLALILIALVSGNKDAANSVGKVIRIGLFLFLISLSWFILIGYSIFYFFSYTDKGWYSGLGIVALVIIPPLFAWGSKNDIKALFKQSERRGLGHEFAKKCQESNFTNRPKKASLYPPKTIKKSDEFLAATLLIYFDRN